MSDTLATALIGPRGPRGAQIIPGSGAPTDAPSQQAGDLWLDVSESHTLTLYGPKDKVTGWPSTPLLTVNGSGSGSGLTSDDVNTLIAAAIAALPTDGVTNLAQVQTAITAALAPYETTSQVTAAITTALAPYPAPDDITTTYKYPAFQKITDNPTIFGTRIFNAAHPTVMVDENDTVQIGNTLYLVSGWNGSFDSTSGENFSSYDDYLPFILPYDLTTDTFGTPVQIPCPAGAPLPQPPITADGAFGFFNDPGFGHILKYAISPGGVAGLTVPAVGALPQLHGLDVYLFDNAAFAIDPSNWPPPAPLASSVGAGPGGLCAGQLIMAFDDPDGVVTAPDVTAWLAAVPEEIGLLLAAGNYYLWSTAAIRNAWGFEGGFYGALTDPADGHTKVYFGGGDSNLYDDGLSSDVDENNARPWSTGAGRQLMSYDPQTGVFTTLAVKPHGHDYDLYAVGDNKLLTLTRTLEPGTSNPVMWLDAYDPATNTWTTENVTTAGWGLILTDVGYPGDMCRGQQVGRTVYWASGYGITYDLDAHTWSLISDPMNPGDEWYTPPLLAPDGTLWVVNTDMRRIDGTPVTIRRFDPTTSTWSDGPTFLPPFLELSGVNIFYGYMGGGFTPSGELRLLGAAPYVGGTKPATLPYEVARGPVPLTDSNGTPTKYIDWATNPATGSPALMSYGVLPDGSPDLTTSAPVGATIQDVVNDFANRYLVLNRLASSSGIIDLLNNGSGVVTINAPWGSLTWNSSTTSWVQNSGPDWRLTQGTTPRFRFLYDSASGEHRAYLANGTSAVNCLVVKDASLDTIYYRDSTGVEHDLTAGGGGSANVIETVNTVAANGPITLPDPTVATMHDVTVQAACAITLPAPIAGASFQVAVTQDLAGGHAVTFVGPVIWPGAGTAVAPDTTAQRMSLYSFESFDGVNYEVVPPENSRPQRGIYELTGTIASGQNELTWTTTPLADEQMLDYTDPKRPTALVAGIYAVSVMGWTDTTTANPWTIHLDLDVDNIGAENWGTALPGSGRSKAGAALTYYVPQGGGFSFSIEHTEAAPLAFMGQAGITLIQPVTLPVI